MKNDPRNMFRTRRIPTNEGRTNPRRSRTAQVSPAYADMVQQLTPGTARTLSCRSNDTNHDTTFSK